MIKFNETTQNNVKYWFLYDIETSSRITKRESEEKFEVFDKDCETIAQTKTLEDAKIIALRHTRAYLLNQISSVDEQITSLIETKGDNLMGKPIEKTSAIRGEFDDDVDYQFSDGLNPNPYETWNDDEIPF